MVEIYLLMKEFKLVEKNYIKWAESQEKPIFMPTFRHAFKLVAKT